MFKPFECGDVVLYSTGLQKKLHKGTFVHYRGMMDHKPYSFGVEISIDDEKVVLPVEYCIPFKNNEHLEGEILWDTTKPNGTPRKLLDVSKAKALGWTYKTELEEGIRLSYEDFLNNPMRAER